MTYWFMMYQYIEQTSDEEAHPPYPENWFYFISNSWNALQDEY